MSSKNKNNLHEDYKHHKLPADDLSSAETKLHRLGQRVPLQLKMVLFTLIIGLMVWSVLDYAQSSNLRDILRGQLNERLSRIALENRLGFDSYIHSFQNSLDLLMVQPNLGNYINKISPVINNVTDIKHHDQPPEWFPDRSALRSLIMPTYALLFNSENTLKEVYSGQDKTAPPKLLESDSLLIARSLNQGYMTVISGSPYIITSRAYVNAAGRQEAAVMFVSPLDEQFLRSALGSDREHLIAFISNEKSPRIIVSSNNIRLPKGSRISYLKKHYLLTDKNLFSHGASDFQAKLVSFVSLEEVNSMTASFIGKARQERAVLGFALILTFTLLIYWITRHLQIINARIANFSREVLGREPLKLPKGDQLHILKERFNSLTEEIIASREIIKKQAEEKADLIADNSFDAIITADKKGVVQQWNAGAEDLFGWSQEEAVGNIAADTIIPPQHQYTILQHTLDSQNQDKVETTAYHRDGHEFPVELSLTKTGTSDDHSLIAIVRDITQRKKSEQDLMLFQNLINQSNDAMMIVDPQTGKYLYVNNEACKSLGYSRDELLNMYMKDIEVVLTDDFSWFRHAERIQKMNNMIIESHHKRKDETVFPVEISVKFIGQGASSYLVAIIRDITERKSYDRQIQSALSENKTLLREIHHRVKNNLQIISSFFNLQKGHIHDSNALSMINECQNRIKAIALVHEKLYRTEQFTNIDLKEYIADMIKSLAELYEIKQNNISIHMDMESIMINVNVAIPCGLIINELVSNALQHAFPNSSRGRIVVKIHSVNNEILLHISDNGRDISSSPNIEEGQPLGLLIVETLVNQLNGKITVDKNNGTFYNIRFGRGYENE